MDKEVFKKGILQGKTLKYGDNINTDIISPPQYMELGIAESAPYAMSAIDPDFPQKVKSCKIITAGDNFGSGSSRETAPLTLKQLGVEAIIAKFFARIFYRNAINVGLLVVECPQADEISSGDLLEIHLMEGEIFNKTTGKVIPCGKIPTHLLELVGAGGLVEQLRKQREVITEN